MNKEDVAYNGILLSYKKEWNFVICSNMDGLGEYYLKWNKSDKERQILYHITHMWNLKKCNKLVNITKNRLTDIENKLVVTSGGGFKGVGERHKLSGVR